MNYAVTSQIARLRTCADRNQKKAIKAIMVAIARLKTCADRNRQTQASMMLHVSTSHLSPLQVRKSKHSKEQTTKKEKGNRKYGNVTL